MTAAKKTHGGRRPGAGRPPSGKVKLTCRITPETREKLGDKPGEAIDRAFSEPNATTQVSCLDLGCCGGSAARGYARAGMVVTGIDIEPQPNYPYRFIMADMIEYVSAHGQEYDYIHASPPCQGYSKHVTSNDSRWCPTRGKGEPKLIAKLREILNQLGKPYCIENVMGAREHMNPTLILCGTMFGLPIARHRLFECNFHVAQPNHPKCRGVAKLYAERRGWEYRDMSVTGKGRRSGCAERWKEILRLDGALTQHQIVEAIPPAYTEYIGNYAVKAANDLAQATQPAPQNDESKTN